MNDNKLINFLIRNELPLDNVLTFLKRCNYDQKPPLSLYDDTVLGPDEFAHLLLEEIHVNIQWLLKKEIICDTPRRGKTKCLSRNSLPTNSSDNSLSNSSSTCKIDSSLNSIETRSTEKKVRPRLQLFPSPQKISDIQGTPESAVSTSFHTSTPCKSVNSLHESFNDSIWNSWDFPSSPGNTKSWNRSCNELERKITSPTWQGSLSHEDTKGKGKAKLSLGDFVGKDGLTPKGKGRRIKPMKVANDLSKNAMKDNPFSNSPLSQKTNQQDRSLLKKECADVLSRLKEVTPPRVNQNANTAAHQRITHFSPSFESKNDTSVSVKTKSPSVSLSDSNIIYDSNAVTNAAILIKLSQIYALMLRENYCENISSELYFIMSILVAKGDSTTESKLEPFDTLQNCAFFAAYSLFQLGGIINLLSCSCIRMLATNPAIEAFVPDFRSILEEQYDIKIRTACPDAAVTQDGNVSFQCDTDNVANFASRQNFTQFRKQRDGFYQLLQAWEQFHNTSQWNFQLKLGSKVRSIIAICDDATNLMHFARLFRSQLLSSCSVCSSSVGEASKEVLELLPSAARERLLLLEARMNKGPVTKHGPAPPPSFPGRQLFFQEFIKACGPGMFIHFLKLSLIDELLRLNDTEFSTEAADGIVDDLTLKRYFECVSSCCLLAKFLSFAEFLPYPDTIGLTKDVVAMHRTIRSKALPLFDLKEIIQVAINNGRLILTIPWVVSYMSLMDRVSAGLPAYTSVWTSVISVPQTVSNDVTPAARFMLQLCVGWLLHVSYIPADLETCEVTVKSQSSTQMTLDKMNVVAEKVLYNVCPYLSELNTVLAGADSPIGRHIRPTPTTPRQHPQTHAKQLQLKLEENFLKNQSSSTRKSIQFVVERVSSCCVKHISAEIIPQIKLKIKQLLTEEGGSNVEWAIQKWENLVRCESQSIAWEMSQFRVTQALPALLGRDVAAGAVHAAVSITIRQSVENALAWVNAHIDGSRNEMKKSFTYEPKDVTEGHYEVICAESPHLLTDLITALREANSLALLGQATSSVIRNIIHQTRVVLNELRVPLPTQRGLFCLYADLLLWTYTLCPDVEEDLNVQLGAIVRELQDNSNFSPFERVLCPRNLLIVPNVKIVHFVTFLVDRKLLTRKKSLSQAVNSKKYNLSNDILEEISRLIDKISLETHLSSPSAR